MLAMTKTRIVALALVGLLAAAPSAHARPADAATPPVTLARTAPAIVAPAVDRRSTTGFDWGDAGIGAAATLALIALGAGAATAGRGRRRIGSHA